MTRMTTKPAARSGVATKIILSRLDDEKLSIKRASKEMTVSVRDTALQIPLAAPLRKLRVFQPRQIINLNNAAWTESDIWVSFLAGEFLTALSCFLRIKQ